MNKKKEKKILLKGEGMHQHALVGIFDKEGIFLNGYDKDESPSLIVSETCMLVHEKPDGTSGEHKTLEVEAGKYQMGAQVEYNPFTGEITGVWD